MYLVTFHHCTVWIKLYDVRFYLNCTDLSFHTEVKGQGAQHSFKTPLSLLHHLHWFSNEQTRPGIDAKHFCRRWEHCGNSSACSCTGIPPSLPPRCQLADGRSWHVARSAGRISCHHGDCFAGRDSCTVWKFTQNASPHTVTHLTSPQWGLTLACEPCSSAGDRLQELIP